MKSALLQTPTSIITTCRHSVHITLERFCLVLVGGICAAWFDGLTMSGVRQVPIPSFPISSGPSAYGMTPIHSGLTHHEPLITPLILPALLSAGRLWKSEFLYQLRLSKKLKKRRISVLRRTVTANMPETQETDEMT
jgi:hypothetical protein